jgi:hypothetical protein
MCARRAPPLLAVVVASLLLAAPALAEHTLVRQWGGQKPDDGEFNLPAGIAVAPSGEVFVADTDNNRIEVFDSAGNFLRKWGALGGGDGQFRGPEGISCG